MFPDMIEMGEFGADPAEIVPDAGENGLDFIRRLLREGGGQVGAADPLFAQLNPNMRVTIDWANEGLKRDEWPSALRLLPPLLPLLFRR